MNKRISPDTTIDIIKSVVKKKRIPVNTANMIKKFLRHVGLTYGFFFPAFLANSLCLELYFGSVTTSSIIRAKPRITKMKPTTVSTASSSPVGQFAQVYEYTSSLPSKPAISSSPLSTAAISFRAAFNPPA